ncbi:MAG: HEAT repeat domain-containing protein, partial [Gemmatimonadota bacterium]
MSHVIGVKPLQQYLVAFPGGRLQTLPLAWDTRPAADGGQRWFHIYGDEPIEPDDPLYWTGIQQNFNSQCAECHVTDIRKGYDPASRTFETDWAEIDVSCEACHGPGSVHVARAEEDASEGREYERRADDFPADLGPEASGQWRWNDAEGRPVCTTPTGASDQIDTSGRSHSRRGLETPDYVYGASLLDTHRPVLPREPLYFADGQIRDEVYVWGSFLQSRMHGAGVLCSDCHEPHSGQLLAPGAAVCLRCHAPTVYDGPQHDFHPRDTTAAATGGREDAAANAAGTGTPSCLDCHMPERTYMGVDDRADHSLRVPRPDVAARVGAPDPCTTCHQDATPEWATHALTEWYGPDGAHTEPHYGEAFAAAAERGASWPQQVGAVLDDPDTPPNVRAAAIDALSSAHPRHLLSRFLDLAADPDPVVRRTAMEAAMILVPEDRVQVAGPALTDPVLGVRAAAVHSLAGQRSTLPLDLQAAVDTARAEWIEGQLAMAERPAPHVNLGVFLASEGRTAEAERSLRTALDQRLSPTGRPGPEAAPLVHARGLARVRAGRQEEALQDLALAAALAPEATQFAYVHVIALLDLQGPDSALDALAGALDRHPRDPRLLSLAVSLHHQRGEPDAALAAARRLMEIDPG